jgi:hypothetical protein
VPEFSSFKVLMHYASVMEDRVITGGEGGGGFGKACRNTGESEKNRREGGSLLKLFVFNAYKR